jgi:hypothetical protein
VICSGLAIVGVAVTGVLSAIRAPKYKEILEESKGSKPVAVAKTYWPAIASGVVTCSLIVVAEGLGLKEIAALGAMAGYATRNRAMIERKVKEVTGKDSKDILKKIKSESTKETAVAEYAKHPSIELTGNGDLLCFEGYSGRWFRSSAEAVEAAVKNLNKRFKDGEYLSLNDFHEELGITPTHFGSNRGWVPDDHEDALDRSHWVLDEIEIELVPCDDLGKLPMGQFLDEPVLLIEVWDYPIECFLEI